MNKHTSTKTVRNVKLWWEEPENISNDSEPTKNLKENLSHKYCWKILFSATDNKRIRKILGAPQIALKRPILKKQIESKSFCYFVTTSHENFITFNCYVFIKTLTSA